MKKSMAQENSYVYDSRDDGSMSSNSDDGVVSFVEDADDLLDGGLVVFEEELDENLDDNPDKDRSGDDIVEWAEEQVESISEYYEDISDEFVDVAKSLEDDGVHFDEEDMLFTLPGASGPLDDDEKDEDVEVLDWESGRNSDMFMDYISSAYPSKIPQHDGMSMVGCEKAMLFLNGLNKEISEAIRLDEDGNLESSALEDYRVNIMRDMVLLKERMGELKKRLNQKTRDGVRKDAGMSGTEMVKEATTPKITLVATAFERAIVGILINAVVSAGHPVEIVYEYLKEKYDIGDREELAIMQLLMDSGYHMFKDRGAIGDYQDDKDAGGNSAAHGVDFIKNYFS